ncbi:MAG: ABC transporter ATP-binding protein [Rhizobiaceae bacterium]|nr:ABC transporter ATP-binding protein [Rhizobiaceae bacterium]
MLDVKNLRVSYDRMLAVEDVSLKVGKGQLVAVVGANGAGKSTTLRAISGIVKAEGGTIRLNDTTLNARSAYQIARLGVAHVPEGRGLFSKLTVDENLRLGSINRSDRAAISRDREKVLAYFPALTSRINQPAGVLSGGEQQQLSIARALLSAPQVLLVDELSLGLSPQLVSMLMGVLVDLAASGLAVLCVEQNTRMALSHAAYGYVIENGRISREGPGKDLLNDQSLVQAYLGSHHVD